jgi:hypothetical protein
MMEVAGGCWTAPGYKGLVVLRDHGGIISPPLQLEYDHRPLHVQILVARMWCLVSVITQTWLIRVQHALSSIPPQQTCPKIALGGSTAWMLGITALLSPSKDIGQLASTMPVKARFKEHLNLETDVAGPGVVEGLYIGSALVIRPGVGVSRMEGSQDMGFMSDRVKDDFKLFVANSQALGEMERAFQLGRDEGRSSASEW